MDGFTRYAIYFAPQPGKLADFGATWLGSDVDNTEVYALLYRVLFGRSPTAP